MLKSFEISGLNKWSSAYVYLLIWRSFPSWVNTIRKPLSKSLCSGLRRMSKQIAVILYCVEKFNVNFVCWHGVRFSRISPVLLSHLKDHERFAAITKTFICVTADAEIMISRRGNVGNSEVQAHKKMLGSVVCWFLVIWSSFGLGPFGHVVTKWFFLGK